MAELRFGLRIADAGKQGVPALHLPYRKAPKKIGANAAGAFSDDGTVMARELDLSIAAESLGHSFKTKWAEASPLSGVAGAHTYGGLQTTPVNMPGCSVSILDFPGVDQVEAARRLQRMLDWLEFCHCPWTGLGRAPLLQLVIGVRSQYVYLESFDPKVEEFMPDIEAFKQVAFLPYKADFSLAFRREPLGLAALTQADIPKSKQLAGGTGGILPSSKGN